MLDNFGYIFLLVLFSLICFWQFAHVMNERAKTQSMEIGLSRKEARVKQRDRYRKICFLIGCGIVWLIVVIWSIASGNFFVSLLLTAIIAALIVYAAMGSIDEEKTIAFKHLAGPLGLAEGFALGIMLKLGVFTYILGIALAVGCIAGIHFICRDSIDDLDDEEEEAPVHVEVPQHRERTGEVYRVPSTTSAPTNKEKTTTKRRRRTKPKADEESDAVDRDRYIIEQLAKTEEGREQLLEMLRAGK